MIVRLVSLIRYLRACAARRRRLEATLAHRPPEILIRDGLRVDVTALARGLLARHDERGVEALLADPPAYVVSAVRDLARHAAPVPGLLGVVCTLCGTESPTFHFEQLTSPGRLVTRGRCTAGHPLPALPEHLILVG